MTHPPPRKRFQIHLSTATVLMFVAGGLMWANLRRRPVDALGEIIHNGFSFEGYPMGTKAEFFQSAGGVVWAGSTDNNYGWPFTGLFTTAPLSIGRNGKTVREEPTQYEYRGLAIVTNLVLAFAMLLTVWFLCEWLIRRRATRTKN